MKKIIVTSIIVILMTIFAGTVLAKTGTVNTQGLKFRDGASTVDTNIIKRLDKGVTLNILEEVEGGWYKVTYEDKNGYVKKEYIDLNNDDTGTTTGETGFTANQKPNQPANEPSINDDCKMISDTDIYVLPLINSTKISKIKANTVITIISENGNWKYIQSEDKLGWVIASKVQGGKVKPTSGQITQGNDIAENNTVPQENNNTIDNNTLKQNTTSVENTIATVYNDTTSQNTVGDAQTSNNSEYPKTMYVNVEAVNIRRYATTSSDIIDRIELNTPVTVTGVEGNWYKVTWNGIKAYIRNDYLSNNKK